MGKAAKIRLFREKIIIESEKRIIEELAKDIREGEVLRGRSGRALIYQGELEDLLNRLKEMGLDEDDIEIKYEHVSFKEFLKALRKGKRGLLVCPVCGSKNIKIMPYTGWLLPSTYMCEDCGYIGYLVLEVDEYDKD